MNFMAGNLTSQVRNIAEVTKAVAAGDLSRKITVDVKGEILELKNTVNTMVDQLRSFAGEVTRVAREVGTEGKLGGQAQVEGVAGTWKDLTDSVNSMAGNLTAQVRGIAKVVTAVANGDLKRKLTVEAKGEIAELAETINEMIDTLATFADQVTTVAREVGVEGQLGGQAKVPGAAGIWKALTENVNQLAANLTTQVRAIAEVATAVTKGDLTRSIMVEAQGEVAALSNTINEMIRNLRDTTQKNTEQDWLKTNLAKFSRMLQGQRDLTNVGRMVLSELCPVVAAQQAEFYVFDGDKETAAAHAPGRLRVGGQDGDRQADRPRARGWSASARWRSRRSCSTTCPPDYIRISSGLGSAPPRSVLVLPLIFEGQVRGVLELASRRRLQPQPPGVPRTAHRVDRHRAQHDRGEHADGGSAQAVPVARPATPDPAGGTPEDQRGTAGEGPTARPPEPGSRAEERRGRAGPAGAGGEGQATRAHDQVQVRVPREHEPRAADAAQQPAHPLRPALQEPGREPDRQAAGVRQDDPLVRQRPAHAHQRHPRPVEDRVGDGAWWTPATCGWTTSRGTSSGRSGTSPRTRTSASRPAFDPRLPRSIYTDAKRLQQIIKNLLSNAFKFTHHGQVTLTVEPADGGWSPDNEELNRAAEVLCFAVSDTGIGIPSDKQQIIFEAFQQADG